MLPVCRSLVWLRLRAACCLAAVWVLSLGPAAGAALAAAGKGHSVTSQATATVASSSSTSVPVPGSGPLSGGVAPVSPVPTTTSTTPTVVNTSTSTAGGAGLSGGGTLAIVVGAVAILGGISYFIWRDARRRAPVKGNDPGGFEIRRSGSKAPPKPRKLSPAERRRRKRGRARR